MNNVTLYWGKLFKINDVVRLRFVETLNDDLYIKNTDILFKKISVYGYIVVSMKLTS